MIRPVHYTDASTLAGIYNHYIVNTPVTFEELEVSANDILQRIERIAKAGLPWLVAQSEGEIIGYCYAGPWRERSAYRYSVEATVYLAPHCVGGGWGTRLYEALFDELEKSSVHAVIGGITLPNPASVALHEKMGMTKVAEFPEVGYKHETWLDVGYWQRLL